MILQVLSTRQGTSEYIRVDPAGWTAVLTETGPATRRPCVTVSRTSLRLNTATVESHTADRVRACKPGLDDYRDTRDTVPGCIEGLQSPTCTDDSPVPPPSLFSPFTVEFLSGNLEIGHGRLVVSILTVTRGRTEHKHFYGKGKHFYGCNKRQPAWPDSARHDLDDLT